MDQYQEHLDWHFRQNRNEKEGMKVAKYRQWYYDVVVSSAGFLVVLNWQIKEAFHSPLYGFECTLGR
jgi:hypothetical protein